MGPLGKSLGMAKKPLLGEDEEEGEDYSSPPLDMDDEAEEPASDLPAGFDAAFEEYSAAPTAQGLYDLIEMCKGGGAEKPGGLALILGGKGKK